MFQAAWKDPKSGAALDSTRKKKPWKAQDDMETGCREGTRDHLTHMEARQKRPLKTEPLGDSESKLSNTSRCHWMPYPLLVAFFLKVKFLILLLEHARVWVEDINFNYVDLSSSCYRFSVQCCVVAQSLIETNIWTHTLKHLYGFRSV